MSRLPAEATAYGRLNDFVVRARLGDAVTAPATFSVG